MNSKVMYVRLDNGDFHVVESYREFYNKKIRKPRTERVTNKAWLRLVREATEVDRLMKQAELRQETQVLYAEKKRMPLQPRQTEFSNVVVLHPKVEEDNFEKTIRIRPQLPFPRRAA